MKEVQLVHDISEIPKNSRLVLYGAGGFCENLLRRLTTERLDCQVQFLCDTFKKGEMDGYTIIAPADLEGVADQYDILFITTGEVSRNGILKVIDGMNIPAVYAGSDIMQSQLFFVNVLDGYFRFNAFNIEITGKCNMACSFCGFRGRQEKHMPFSLFTEIIDQIVEGRFSKTIQLAGGGEALLYPWLDEAIRYCRDKGLYPRIITNGLALNKERYRRMVESGLDLLSVSLHNLSEKTFAYRGTKDDFNKYFQNVMGIVDYHLERDFSSGLQIILMIDGKNGPCSTSEIWQFPAVSEDTKDFKNLVSYFLETMEEIASKHQLTCAVDRAAFHDTVVPGQWILAGNVKLNIFELDANITVKKRYVERDNVVESGGDIFFETADKGSCYVFLQNPQISANGNLLPCCTDAITSDLVLGQISHEVGMGEIFSSSKYRQLISGFQNGDLAFSPCQICKGTFHRRER